MRNFILSLTILAGLILSGNAQADDFMDTGVPSKPISIGVRFGLNSSGHKMALDGYSDNVSVNHGTGWTAGAVVDLNVREFFSVQPGFFYENRSYDYTVIRHSDNGNVKKLNNEIGHTRYNMFTIPVLAVFRFNITSHLQWDVAAGPYFGFSLGNGSDDVESIAMSYQGNNGQDNSTDSYSYVKTSRDFYGGEQWQHKSFDWGLKIGTGIRLNKRYSLSFYYMNGFKDISADRDWTMKNHSWSFVLGYDF